MRNNNRQETEKSIALDRIKNLFDLADENFSKRKDLSNAYVTLARKISMRQKVRIPPLLKRKFCKHCHTFLKQGANCRVRLTEGHVTYFCLECKKYMRFGYMKEQKAKRSKK